MKAKLILMFIAVASAANAGRADVTTPAQAERHGWDESGHFGLLHVRHSQAGVFKLPPGFLGGPRYSFDRPDRGLWVSGSQHSSDRPFHQLKGFTGTRGYYKRIGVQVWPEKPWDRSVIGHYSPASFTSMQSDLDAFLKNRSNKLNGYDAVPSTGDFCRWNPTCDPELSF